MVDKYIAITRIIKDLYDDNECCKIVLNTEQVITNDPLKIINALNIKDNEVNYVIRQLKDVFQSKLCHRRYCARLLYNFLVFSPQVEYEDLKNELKLGLTQIRSILNSNKISIENLEFSKIFEIAFKGFPVFFEILKKLEIKEIENLCVQKIKCGGKSHAKLKTGAYFSLKSDESGGLKYFLQRFNSNCTKGGKSVYAFSGNIIIKHSIKPEKVPNGSLLITSEACIVNDSENIHSVPPGLIKSLKKFSGFYPSINIKLWDTISTDSSYSNKILYGSENYLHAEITNIFISFDTNTLFLLSPTDAQLESLHVFLMRFVHKLKQFTLNKTLLPTNIDQILAESLKTQTFKQAFKHIPTSIQLQDFNSKEFMITKTLDLYLQIINFSSTSH